MSKTPTVIAVVIARAGSKGLPGKNVRMLKGCPLVTWAIDHALYDSSLVDEVVVTSDDPRVLDLAEFMGVYAFSRPPELASDTATVDAAARHGVECWEADTGQRCDAVAILYGNVPIRPADLTDRAIAKLIETGCDSVQSVSPVGKMHPLWMRKLDGDRLENYQPSEIYRRQDLPPVYMLNAGALVMTRASLFTVDPAHPHACLGRDRRAIVTEADEVVDVDTELDLMIASAILDARNAHEKPPASRSQPGAER